MPDDVLKYTNTGKLVKSPSTFVWSMVSFTLLVQPDSQEAADGETEGEIEGLSEGLKEGLSDGLREGDKLGLRLGDFDTDGLTEGERDGLKLGDNEGERLGDFEGLNDGDNDGDKDGDKLTEGETEGEVEPPYGAKAAMTSAHRDAAPKVHAIVTSPAEAFVFSANPPSIMLLYVKLSNSVGPASRVKELAAEPLHAAPTTTALLVKTVMVLVAFALLSPWATPEASGACCFMFAYVTAIAIAPPPVKFPVKETTMSCVPASGANKYHISVLSVAALVPESLPILVKASPL